MKKYRTFARWDGQDQVRLDYVLDNRKTQDENEWQCVKEYSNMPDKEWKREVSDLEYNEGDVIYPYEYFPVEVEVEDD